MKASLLLSCFLFSVFGVAFGQNFRLRCDIAQTDDPASIENRTASILSDLNFTSSFLGLSGPITKPLDLPVIPNLLGAASQPANINISVFFHVINKGPGYANGDLNATMIQGQINYLNSAIDGSGFFLVLNSTDHTTNSVWFNMTQGSTQETAAKQYLHKGTAQHLNIYSVYPGDGNVGWGTFPWNYNSSSFVDGIVIMYSTVPGGTAAPYNLGATAAHELGHWFGLYHTFQGGCCDGTSCGDYVSDTPAEANANYGCPSPVPDSCSSSGKDPVGNYMDYTYDSCMYYYTYGQATRMSQMWAAYRSGQ